MSNLGHPEIRSQRRKALRNDAFPIRTNAGSSELVQEHVLEALRPFCPRLFHDVSPNPTDKGLRSTYFLKIMIMNDALRTPSHSVN